MKPLEYTISYSFQGLCPWTPQKRASPISCPLDPMKAVIVDRPIKATPVGKWSMSSQIRTLHFLSYNEEHQI